MRKKQGEKRGKWREDKTLKGKEIGGKEGKLERG